MRKESCEVQGRRNRRGYRGGAGEMFTLHCSHGTHWKTQISPAHRILEPLLPFGHPPSKGKLLGVFSRFSLAPGSANLVFPVQSSHLHTFCHHDNPIPGGAPGPQSTWQHLGTLGLSPIASPHPLSPHSHPVNARVRPTFRAPWCGSFTSKQCLRFDCSLSSAVIPLRNFFHLEPINPTNSGNAESIRVGQLLLLAGGERLWRTW